MVLSGEEVEHGWVEGALGSSSAGRSFYSGCYRSFVTGIFTASIAYHVVVLLHTVRGPCSEADVLLVTTVACRPYPCQVGRIIVDSSMPVSGRLRCVGSITLEI
ncbi:hypothetical protein BHE74_00029696 [Ensete ventricosum]|nr:hypothetical protein BHE74_00029696 [Ensete ventricosum]